MRIEAWEQLAVGQRGLPMGHGLWGMGVEQEGDHTRRGASSQGPVSTASRIQWDSLQFGRIRACSVKQGRV